MESRYGGHQPAELSRSIERNGADQFNAKAELITVPNEQVAVPEGTHYLVHIKQGIEVNTYNVNQFTDPEGNILQSEQVGALNSLPEKPIIQFALDNAATLPAEKVYKAIVPTSASVN